MSYIEENGYFIFGDVKSSDYGVWISGGGTFNAPARRYKEYIVPGRNGTLTIDEWAYEEAEVTYPAFIARDFPANVEAFRNAIMAQNGYVRMTDSYHPDEYYLARYMAGLEVDTLPAGRGGSFELTFRRDPRRFLLSGEEPVTYPPGAVSNNILPFPFDGAANIKNPTLFSSKPIIKVTPNQDNMLTLPADATINGITFTVSGDTVTASGTATNTVGYRIRTLTLPAGKYLLSGCPVGGSVDKCIWAYSGAEQIALDSGSGSTFELTAQENVTFAIFIGNGQTVSDMKFKPSLTYDQNMEKTITIGRQDITVKNISPYVIVNSEMEDCYYNMNNLNSQVTFRNGEYPVLNPGINSVVKPDTIKSVEIVPNWYRL